MPPALNAKRGDRIELAVEKLVYGGEGLARSREIVCFVDGAIPGETIVARIDSVKSHYLKATTLEVREQSSYRTSPACALFQQCGGCQWQHISYAHQVYWKGQIVADCLSRIAGIPHPTVLPPVQAASPLHYRIRTNLKVLPGHQPLIGFFARRTHTLVPVDTCALLQPQLNSVIPLAHELFMSTGMHEQSPIDLNLLFVSSHNLVRACFPGHPQNRHVYFKNGVLLQSSPYGELYEVINGMCFCRTDADFYQVNHEQNLQLIHLVLEHIDSGPRRKVLDLYCGCGNFSMFLARRGAVVTGIDISNAAIHEAAVNARLNGIATCHFFAADLHAEGCTLPDGSYDAILLNPPRGGCSKKLVYNIVLLRPQTIVYVSCNPSTLARDLRLFLSAGYRLQTVQPVDMFPQTYHIETVVKLVC